MADIHPGGGSTIKQLLHTLQEQLASTMFVALLVQYFDYTD